MRIYTSHRVNSSKVKATKMDISARVLTPGELSRFKTTTYQFKETINGTRYKFYSRPKEQYVWEWFAVPY